MALLGSSIDPSLFINDYSGFARAGATQGQMYADLGSQIGSTVQAIGKDYATEQKKAKQIAANIKGSLTLLDNAKGIYKDLAPQIDAMKTKLIDPSISDEEKLVLSSQIEPLVNMYANYGMEGAKIRLMEAQAAEARAGRVSKARVEPRTMYDAKLGRNVEMLVNLDTGIASPIIATDQTSIPVDGSEMPSQDIPASRQPSLGAPPVMAPTIEGPEIPLGESQRIKTLDNGDEVRMYQGKQYIVPTPSVLPPISQAEGVQPSQIASAAALPVGQPAVQQDAIRTAAEMQVQPVAGARFGPPAKSPEEIEAKQRRGRLEESQIAANIAATTKQTEEAKAKEEKQVMSEKQKLAAAQDARATIRDAIVDVKKYAKKIGENWVADIAKRGAQYFSSSDQAKLTEAIKPISAKMIWDQMSKLREASATGSTGLGSLTEGERRNLEATVTSLDPMQSPSGIIKGMAKIEDYMRNAEFGNREERKMLVEEGKMTPARYNEIEKGYSKPDIIPETGAIRNTAADKSILDKY